MSEEQKRKIGLANSGKRRTEKEKQHLSEVLTGRKLTIEHRKKLSLNHPRYWLGKKRGPQSEAWKKKRADALRGRKRPDFSRYLLQKNPNKGKFGKSHPCWKEEKRRPLYKSIRETYKYRQWRSDIFTRDNFTCSICKKYGGELNADHYPKRFTDIIREYAIQTLQKALMCKELWDISNGRTLCLVCHRQTDTWGRRKN